MEINNNIQEGYVSFPVAKLLKEKGLNCKVDAIYQDGELRELPSKNTKFHSSRYCSAPTTALAILWIRENFNIEVETTCIKFSSPKKKGYQFITISDDYQTFKQLGDFETREDACQAGIEYTLKRLI